MKAKLRAFTLIELLVVIAIIGILGSLLLVSVHKIGGRGQAVACKNNLHQVYLALEMYRNENDGYYPYAALLPSAKLNDLPRICEVLAAKLGNPNVLKCPGDTKNYFKNEGSSYEYNGRMGGRKVLQGRWSDILGTTRIPIFYDYEEFHGQKGDPASRNFVYLDGHIGASQAIDPEVLKVMDN